MTADAFPSLAGNSSSNCSIVAVTASSALSPGADRTGQQQYSLPPRAGVRRSISAPSFAEAAKQQQLQQQQRQQQQQHRLSSHHHQQQQQQQQHQQQQPPMQNGLSDVVQQLAQFHPWCEPELLQEVLASVDNDAAAAAAALADLAPAGSCGQPLSRVQHDASGNTAVAAGSSDTGSVSAAAAVPKSGGSASGTEQQHEQQQQPEQQEQQERLGSGDIYHRVRNDALRLTRQWQKVLRR
jgi:hypothetical protein